jgi:hypothetical protein
MKVMQTGPAALAVLGIAIAAVASCARSNDPSPNKNTNWLRGCKSDAMCGTELSCLCGICTKPCGTTAECSDPDGATCRSVEDERVRPRCEEDGARDALAICVASCTGAACDDGSAPAGDAGDDDTGSTSTGRPAAAAGSGGGSTVDGGSTEDAGPDTAVSPVDTSVDPEAPPSGCSAAEACRGDFYPGTQAELEELSRCRSISGELSFRGSEGAAPPDAIHNLEPLACLEQVNGRIHIQYLALVESLHGLHNLRRVGTLEVEHMVSLASLDGLEALEEVGNGIHIHYRNTSLVDVDALQNVALRGGPLSIDDAPWLSRCAVDALIEALEANGSTPSETSVSEIQECASPMQCEAGECIM